MENKRFHLQLIENVIERMAKNSFIIKGWTLTALGGLATLYIANQDKKMELRSFNFNINLYVNLLVA